MALLAKLLIVALCLAAMASSCAAGAGAVEVQRRRGRRTPPPAGHHGGRAPPSPGVRRAPPPPAGHHGGRAPPSPAAPPSPPPPAPHHSGGVPPPSAPAAATLPSAVDWRAQGAVSPPKDQGQELGDASWAFAVVAAIEGAQKISRGELVALSAQQLVDCANAPHITPVEALDWVVKNGGIASEARYPYTGSVGICKDLSGGDDLAATISGYGHTENATELALMAAVARQPVAVSMAVEFDQFRSYEPGSIYTGPCAAEFNHALAVVGYGASEDGETYWIAKNSFGPQWGDEGYILIRRGGDDIDDGGLCGIAKRATYATMG
ncbi:hypothetical protein ACP4OV_002538 [Aristida adscensionis]